MKGSTISSVLKQLGSLYLILGLAMMAPVVVSVIYTEWYSAAGFLLSAAITSGLGSILIKIFRKAEEPRFYQASLIAAAGWLAVMIIGGLPFFVVASITPDAVMSSYIPAGVSYSESSLIHFRNPFHCIFESISGFTTTGLTMAVHEPSVGHGILFYRSLTQWIGGAGFIVMILAFMKQMPGRSAILLYGSETSGEKIRPSVLQTARSIWKVYLSLTLFNFIYLVTGTFIILPGYPLESIIFDSINHAMTGMATGGFSTLDDSIAGYNSGSLEMIYLLPMILGSLSLPFYFRIIYDRKYNEIWKDIQTRSLMIFFIFGSLVLVFILQYENVVTRPVFEGIFQFVSAQSGTGWQTSNVGNWDWVSILFIVLVAMIISGAQGSTVGGIKMIRALLILKGIGWEINKALFSENTVRLTRFNGRTMFRDKMNETLAQASILAILYVLLLFSSAIIVSFFMSANFTFSDALFESASAQGTIGLSTGITYPTMNPVIEIIYMFQMWAGRLEIIPVLLLFRAVFWGTKPL